MLTNQSFVDPEKLDKIAVSHSFGGRDLRLAVLYGADLRKSDFTGAQLQGASLDKAQLQGALLVEAQLQGARLDLAQLQGASLFAAQLQGAWLSGAQLKGADLVEAQLQGADLKSADLQGADLGGAQLKGADLAYAQLQGASLNLAHLQGASLGGAQLQGAWLVNVSVWRAFGTPNLDLAEVRDIDADSKPWQEPWHKSFGGWRDAIANSVPAGRGRDGVISRLAELDPTRKKEREDLLDQRYWERAHSFQPQGEEFRGERAMLLADLTCFDTRFLLQSLVPFGANDSALYVARGLLHNKSLDKDWRKLFIERLLKGKSDPTACPGVRGITDTDWAGFLYRYGLGRP